MKAHDIPHIIKYMGSKRNIMEFVQGAIDSCIIDGNERLYDVFGGSAVVSAAYRNKLAVTCNDIQNYTSTLGKTYLQNYYWEDFPDDILDAILHRAETKVFEFKKKYSKYTFDYSKSYTFQELLKLEQEQMSIIEDSFNGLDHLFARNFSGTYWSFDQNVWIDAFSSVARSNDFRDTFLREMILSSLMFAMAYSTQSTGHYAQFREVTNDNMDDILLYRRKSIPELFVSKFNSLREYFDGSNNSDFVHQVTQLDFEELLGTVQNHSIIYADPPYQFVHYSRFYHALETLVKYDYPELKHKGRYRDDRHQSPFCIKTKVQDAFRTLFAKTRESNSSLVLSYSNTGMISLEKLSELATEEIGNYSVECRSLEYKHSTMGRQGDKSRDVSEAILIYRPFNL